jgi:chromosome segregation ATPase
LVGVIGTGFNANNPDLNYDNITLGRDIASATLRERIETDDNPLLQKGEGNEHGTHVLGIIAATNDNDIGIDGVNDKAPVWVGRANTSNWAESLIEFVDAAKESAQPNAVVNLSLNNLSQDELTFAEKTAIQYAREHNVIVVVPAGNHPEQMSAVAKAAKEFDNIVTVGASDGNNRAFYSATGEGLTLVAEGGTPSNPVVSTVGETTGKMIGTPVAAAKVTGAVSKVWAGNPELNYTQVIDVLKNTATDLNTPNWDAETGAGLVNIDAATFLAKATEPQVGVVSVPEVTLTTAEPSANIDLSRVFVGKSLTYEVVGGDSEAIALELDGTQLRLTGLEQSGMANFTIRATDAVGRVAETTVAATNYYLNPPSIATINNNLTQLSKVISDNPEGLIAALSSDEAEASLDALMASLEENPELVQLLANPATLESLGIDNNGIATLKQFLYSEELASEMGLNVSIAEALSQPDTTLLDGFLLNADEATALLPENAKQPKVGFIDFTRGNHLQQVTDTFSSINPLANFDSFNVSGGNWASELVKFVNEVKAAGETRGIANLSFDLSQIDDIGTTTRYELTPAEQQAIQYARDNNVLLVVASGNTGGAMSALGQASQQFDNIITVGAINQFESKADYSAYGDGLTLMAPGGSWQDDSKAFVGTSRATAYASAVASLVWAANPDLSFLQVKQLLIDTAADLDVPGWDAATGAGLVDAKEAIDRAFLVEPEKPGVSEKPAFWQPFSGEGRVQTQARPASGGTEAAINQLQNTQETLFQQWETLAELGNPPLDVGELEAELKDKMAAAFEQYQQVNTDAAITTAQAEQWVEALALATQHYQIEQERLQELLGRQTELEQQLAGLGQQKSALQAETQQLLDGIKAQIAKAESDWAASQAKLSNPFAGVGNSLPTNPQPWRNAASGQQQQAHNFRKQAAALAAESQHYRAVANSINPNRWQVVGYQSRPCGRRKEVWGWGQNPQLVKQKNQYQWLAQITAINSQVLQQLAAQTDQQAAALNQYGQFLENRNNSLALGAGSSNDAAQVLQLLQQQLAQQQALANQYSQQANTAENRRWHSQSHADWHNSQINQWGVVGTKRGRCGKTENVYGWIHHPEHIAPRDRSQQLAHQANAERHMYAQLAQQAQHQANVLAAQVRQLQERLRDWPVLKQGIEYEIAADALRLQAEQDLLAMHEPVQEQKLETLNLQISQAEEELQRLTAEKLPAQQQLTDATEERLVATQSEVETIQQQREAAQKDLQNFLETAGFLLPYRERLSAVEKTIQQLEADKLQVQETIQQLAVALLQAPSDTLREQLNQWSNYLETLAQELEWANLQKDQLAMALADSPERLAIARLIQELEAAKDTTVADEVPVQQYLDFLRGIEGSGANFLEGFDNLEERLAAAKTEQAQTSQALRALQDEYRNLGLEKSNLEDNLIPAKEREIEGTEGAIAQTKTTLATLEPQLPDLQASQGQKTVEVANQEAVVATTQAQVQPQVASIQNQVAAQNAQIHQLQAAVNSYHAQINQANAAAHYHEQQRVYHQNSANHWNGHIGVYNEAAYLAHNPDVAHHVWVLRWLRNGWEHYVKWGRFEGRVPNPQALANRNAHQKAANDNTRARNAHSVRAQQLTAALHSTQHQINVINQHKTSLIQQQQGLQNQLAGQRATLQQLEQELEAITQETETLQAHIEQQQQKLEGLNDLLPQQQQELAELQGQVPLLEQQLIDKYREIELTDDYLSQVQGEVNRLDARLDLLNRAGTLEREYQNKWQQWQDAAAQQAAATEALIATRTAGEGDRSLLASLQSQLTQAQTNLQQAQALQQSINDTQRDVEFKKLQIGNQHLLLQSLGDRDPALAAAQQHYLSQAESSRQRIWSGGHYNAGEAHAYRTYLEQASFIADQRNKAWQQRQQTQNTINQLNQQIAQQQALIGNESWQLHNLGGVPGLQAHINNISNSINTVSQRLQPLQIQEQQQTQALASANTLVQNLGTELVQTARLQATALRQLIGFGVLASESDVDFFLTEVEPSVNSAIEKLRERESELNARLESAKALTTSAEQRLAQTTDAVSKQALTDLVNKLQAQQNNLEELTAQNRTAADELEDLLGQARASLAPLRQKQELEIRQKLENNDARLQALASQFDSEKAAENALEADTVLAYVQLREQIRQDLTDNASSWTQQLLAGHQLTKELGNSQQNLSQSVDELIAYINDNFADPHGEYNRSEADLRDGITTLGVVENRADELDTAFTSTEDAIERIKLRLAQDAALWEEIAPIAIRYGLESPENKALLAQYFALEKQKQERLRLSEGYNYVVNPENGNRYFFSNAVSTWHAAQAEAQGVGGNLVTIRNAAEQDFVRQVVGQQSVWMGLTDAGHEGHWRWVSGEPLTYTNFHAGQPDNNGGVEHWTEFHGQGSGRWNDVQPWNGISQNSKHGLVEVSINDLEDKQRAIANKLSAWAKQHGLENALDLNNLAKYPDGAAAIDFLVAATRDGSNPQWQISQQLNAPNADTLLNAPAVEGRNPLQALYNKSQAAQGSHEAQGHALLAQAAWHEQQAAYHWAHSRKAGPYWHEQRWVKKRSGKGYWQTITHIDHHWVAWQHHSQIFPRLRARGTAHLVEANKWRLEKERLKPLKNQWIEANNAANEAHPVVKEARKIFAQLEAGRSDIPQATTQLEFLETLLPTLQQQLEEAEAEAAAQNAQVRQQWEEYDTDSEEYRAAVADILQRRGELDTQAIETQQQIAESEKWVEGESVALSDELASTKALAANLQQQRENIAAEIAELLAAGVTVGLDELYTKDVQLETSLQMLTNKAAVLTAEQTALTQKRTLLAAQNEVILAEQRLLDAYINDPDADTSNLEQQLLDSRAALADAQRLAEQAEAASQALTAPLQQLKTDLLAQNDQHLQAAKERQQILKALVEATQLNANYTLQAAQKQQEVNNLEFQVLQRLQQATAAGYQEAKHLLDVAKHNDIATAAEIYYRDYSDLASDTGGKCTHGLARPEDRMLADRYYAEMLNNRELQRRAQAQADAFRRAKETAQAQMEVLQGQQATAQELLNALNAKVAETQEQREQKEQELAIAQARLDGITRIRQQTEQTFVQLVTLEKLNLAQAQLEQEIAQNREAEIDAAVAARQERDALELERKRLETQARIEQLRQLQVEDDLRQNVNQVRGSLGLETLEPTENPAQLQTQLAELLANLDGLESEQPDLPDDVKALLAEARGDIHLALQGKEAASIQENLLSAMDGLIGQIEHYKSEINRLDLEEQWDNQLLQTAQSDLQGASQQLLKELERSGALAGERDVIDPLYMEVLNKVALAEQAVDISEDLAAQSREMLEQIIKQRIAERKARKKSFWSSVLGMVSGVIGILGTILSFTPLAPLGIALTAASAGINAIQSIMNGDWLGGIFSIVMAGVNALTAGMGNVLTQGTKLAIQGLQSVAAGAFSGVRSMMSGDSIMGFLQILGGVAGGVTSGLSNVINQASSISQKMLLQVFNSLQSVPTMIYGGIKSIENGDWFSAISGIFNSAIALGTNFAGVFNDTAAKVFEYLGKAGNTALAIGGAIKDGGIESWLSGINSIIGMWGEDIKGLVDRLNGEPLDPTLYEYEDGSLASCSA